VLPHVVTSIATRAKTKEVFRSTDGLGGGEGSAEEFAELVSQLPRTRSVGQKLGGDGADVGQPGGWGAKVHGVAVRN
jgi:hypothetical protein